MRNPSWRDDLYGDYIDTGDDLMHYGVLGMRWGHRKGSSGGSSRGSKSGSSKRSKRLKKAAAIAGAAALAGGAAYMYSKNRNKGGNALAVVNNNRSMQPTRSSRPTQSRPSSNVRALPAAKSGSGKSEAQKRWEKTRSQKDFDRFMSDKNNRFEF